MPGLSYNSILGKFMVFTTDAEVCAACPPFAPWPLHQCLCFTHADCAGCATIVRPHPFFLQQTKWTSIADPPSVQVTRRIFTFNDPSTLLMGVHPSARNILGDANLAFMHGPAHKVGLCGSICASVMAAVRPGPSHWVAQ